MLRILLAIVISGGDVRSFVCNETIERFRSPLTNPSVHHVDTITARVSFEDGAEHYRDVRRNGRRRGTIAKLTGAWSEGEFGSLVRQTQQLLMKQAIQTMSEGHYVFETSEDDSPWHLWVSGRPYRIPFQTEVWTNESSGEIVKLERTSRGISPETGITEIQWRVVLEPVDLNGVRCLLPKSGTYEVRYKERDRREWNTMTFSDYRRYGAESRLRFQEVAK